MGPLLAIGKRKKESWLIGREGRVGMPNRGLEARAQARVQNFC